MSSTIPPQKPTSIFPSASQRTSKPAEVSSHRKVLIIGAVCFSAIAIALTYKVSEDKRNLVDQSDVSAFSGSTQEQSLADQRVIEALKKSQLDMLGALATTTNPFLPSPKDTLSDRYSKDIFTAYANYDQTGEVPDGDQFVSDKDYMDTSDVEKDKYNLAFLPIFEPKNKDEVKTYGNILAGTYLADVSPISSDNTGKYQLNVSLMAPIYRKIGEDLMKIRVPAAVASAHLELANDYIKQADAFVLIDKESDDPVKALLGLKIVRESMPRQVDSFAQINNYFNINGIIFGENEPGNFWNVGTTTVSLQ